MKTNVRIAKRIIAASVVAAGVAILWAIVIGWFVLIGQTLFPTRAWNYESLMVAADGTAVIGTSRITDNVSVVTDRRTLDGKSWPLVYEEWLQSAYFPQPYEPPGLVETPLRWNEGNGRIAGLTDGKVPPAGWYFIRDNDRTGEVYVAGYDGISKLPIGYIGREGFRASKAAQADQFVVPKSTIQDGFHYLILCDQNFAARRLLYGYQIYNDSPGEWTPYLLGPDRLWEIDLRERSVQSWAQFDGAMAIGQIGVTKATFDQLPVQITKTKGELAKSDGGKGKDKTSKARAGQDAEEEAKYAALMAVRQPDRMVFFDLHTGKQQTFVLPDVLRNRRFSAFLVGANQMLIDAHEQFDEYWSGGPIVRLFWIDPQGQIQREKEVNLAGSAPPPPRTVAWRMSVLLPVSIVWLVGTILGAPLYLLQTNYVSDFNSALAAVANIAWPPLIVVLLVAAALTWVTMRLQRKYRRPATAAWTAFVFLFGVPGFFAYLVEHRRPKLEACPQCGKIVPRDRDACAACNTEFAPPPRVGTEIFA